MILKLTACLLLSCTGLATGMNLFSDQWVNHQDTCDNLDCIRVAYEVRRAIDFAVDPCEDFYSFACGGFIKEANIPDNKKSVDEVVPMAESLYEEGKLMMEEEDSPDAWELYKKVKTYYNDCMDMTRRNEIGNAPAKKLFDQLGGWPLLGATNPKPWHQLQADLTNAGLESYNHVMKVMMTADPRNNKDRVVLADQPDLGLERFLLIQEDSEEVQMYLDFVTKIAIYFGADPATAAYEMKKVLEFEQKLAKISLSGAERRSAPGGLLRLDHLSSFSKQSYPGLPPDWKIYLESILHVELDDDEEVGLVILQFFEPLSKLLEETESDVIANYQFTWAAAYLMRFLDDEAMEIIRDYEIKTSGMKEKRPLWKTCLHHIGFNSQVELGLTLITASMYVQKHFKENAKDEMDEMFKDVREALNGTIDQAEWMDEGTKQEARLKLDSMKQIVGYPPEMVNKTLMTNLYEGLDLIDGELMQNTLDINRFWHHWHFQRLHEERDNDYWLDNDDILKVIDVNALYKPTSNMITFSAAILRGMFFNAEAPRFMNYGSIGTIIGHEISHGFDDAGRTMDHSGVMRNWWSIEAETEYHSRARCVVELYSTFFSDQVNSTLDGVATQGENIADIMGNLVAYRGYEIWMEENGVTEEPGLPGLPFSARQMFWISNGRHYCRKIRDQFLLKKIKSDSHSPMEFRINGALMNSDEFARDFNCPKGSKMNPEKKCYMW